MWFIHISTLIPIFLLFGQGNSKNQECGFSTLGGTMNIENYFYTIFASFLGMFIVFLFLGLLCIFMIVLKKIFKENNNKVLRTDSSSEESKDQDWLIAAVSAYLAKEDEGACPYSAEAWKAESSENMNLWIFRGKFSERKSGI